MDELNETKKIFRRLDKDIALSKIVFSACAVIILVLLGTLFYVLYNDRVYVVRSGGGVWESVPESRRNQEILYIEGDDHIRKFYSLFWSFTAENQKGQLDKSYYLGGNVIKNYRTKLVDFYNDVVTNNYIVSSSIDSTKFIGMSNKDGRVRIESYGKMVLENEGIKEIRRLNCTFDLLIGSRVPKLNPHGLTIIDFSVLQDGNATISREVKE